MTRALKLAAPGAALLGATAAVLAVPAVSEPLKPLVPVLPVVMVGVGVSLATAFRRGRVALAVLSLGAAAWAVTNFVAAPDAGTALARYAYAATAVVLPVNLAVIAWLPERGLLTSVGLQRLLVLALEISFVVFVWAAYHPRLIALPEAVMADPRLTAWTPLPQPAVAAFILATVAVLVRLLVSSAAVEAGLWWALLAAFLALHGSPRLGPAWLAGGALVLVVALVQAATSLAFADGLTGLGSRRAFDEDLRRLPERFAVAMVDIDHFKGINDNHGHDVGDQVLRMVAGKLKLVGGGGRSYRYGGEEFAVLFPARGAKEAAAFVDAVRLAVAETPFTLRSPERPRKRPKRVAGQPGTRRTVSVSVSAGVAERDDRAVPVHEVVAAADKALYRAKAAGRNRVIR